MLLYKAWLESRVRFLLAVGGLLVVCVAFLFRQRVAFPLPDHPWLPYSAIVWATFYGNIAPIAFSVVALILGLGGLQRERAAGTAVFTLALPSGRLQMILVRALTGLAEMATLALVPAIVVPALSPVIVGQGYPLSQAMRFAGLFMSWGAVWFAAGFFWSVLLAGDYTAAIVSLLTPVGYMIVLARDGSRIAIVNPFVFMSGLDRFTNGTSTLTGPLPWTSMAVLVGVAAGLLSAAMWITRRQSF